MALTDEGGNMVMPVSPMYGNGYGGGNGLFGSDATMLLILFLFAFMGNGWGGFGGGNNGTTFVANDVQRGFDQSAVMSGINTLSTSVNNGFSNAEVAACNRAMDAMQTAYGNQIASMNQSFANQQALDNRLNSMEMSQQNCCCEGRAAIADLRYTVATEACADRSAVNDALQAVTAQNNANTQRILDQMCSDKIDAKNEKIAELQNQLNFANLAASQTAQTAQLIADNTAQTQYVVNRIAPYPQPAYIVPSPYGYGQTCGQNFYN